MAGIQTVTEVLVQDFGLEKDTFRIEDGSGASRYTVITPHQMANVLNSIYHSEMMRPIFWEALPVWGQVGTLKRRGKSDKNVSNGTSTGKVTSKEDIQAANKENNKVTHKEDIKAANAVNKENNKESNLEESTEEKATHIHPLEGRVRAKTGNIIGVTTLSGYLNRRSGEDMIFVIMINNTLASSETIHQFQEELLLDWIK